MTRIHRCKIGVDSLLYYLALPIFVLTNKGMVGALVSDEGWALLDFKGAVTDVRGGLSTWNAADPYPCDWYGITCNGDLHVDKINLQGLGLLGEISPELRRLPKLRSLVLSKNNLSGPIPPELSEIVGLWKLNLDHNMLSGTIPTELGYFSSLRMLDLSDNALSGPIPQNIFQNCGWMRFVSFAQNKLTGSIPVTLSNCLRLTGFDFSSNSLQGTLADEMSSLVKLDYIALQGNRLSGPIPEVLGSLTSLSYLNMGNNQLSGSLPLQLNQLSSLKELLLNNNLLAGEVPAAIVSLPSLQHLDLSVNSFSGYLPFDEGRCPLLQNLNLAVNEFQGAIPTALGDCSQLMFLSLTSNQLSGALTPDLGRLAKLKSLDVRGNHLVGEIPADISQLTALNVLRLGSNQIDGLIPSEIGKLRELEILDLSSMRLQGGIPPTLASCTALQRLNLSSNNLTGHIPAEISKLSSLRELDLKHNRLNDSIPAALGNLKGLTSFNVSYNHLSGSIPREKSLGRFGFTSFLGNPGLCGAPLSIPCIRVLAPSTENVTHGHQRHFLTGTAIFAIAMTGAVAVAVIVTSLLSILVWRQQNKRRTELLIDERSHGASNRDPVVGKLVLFNQALPSRYEDWERGVKTLLDKNGIVGRGSIGTVYRAMFDGGLTIAVKKLRSSGRYRDAEEYEAEMSSLGNIRHQNLVTVQGYYWSTTLQLILSDFIPNGTLSSHLHANNPSGVILTWIQRYDIGLGIARGLAHLHSNFSAPIMHFNLTSTNILLDENFEAKVSDYGLRKLLPMHDKYISSRMFHTTLAYVAPELACGSLRVSEKCDVYSFGVVLLELGTGREPVEKSDGATVVVREFVRAKLEQGRVADCIDPKVNAYDGYEVVQFLKLALICTSQEHRGGKYRMHIPRKSSETFRIPAVLGLGGGNVPAAMTSATMLCITTKNKGTFQAAKYDRGCAGFGINQGSFKCFVAPPENLAPQQLQWLILLTHHSSSFPSMEVRAW